MAQSPLVGIVILNWRRPDEILDCLASVSKLDYARFEVAVVDNASDNGSVERIRAGFPRAALIENGRNLGFAGGSNVGIRYFMQRGADYIMLLNDDTELAPDMLSALMDAFEEDPDIGIVGPNIFYFDPPDVLWSAGGSVSRYGAARHLQVDEGIVNSGSDVHDVDYVSGCGILIRRSVIERVGPLDERFFAYFEETELCARARAAGFRVVQAPQADMWHKIGRDERAQSRPYLYLTARNRLLYVQCTAGPRAAVIAALDLLRTSISWSLRPRHQHMQPFASALTRGVLDYFFGRFGAPPSKC